MSKNMKEQLKETGIREELRQAERAEMEKLKKYEGEDDPVFVVNAKCYEDVLVVGSGRFEMIQETVRSVTNVTKTRDLNQFVEDGQKFDKIIFVKQGILANSTIERAISLLHVGGLVCFFGEDEFRDCFVETVESMWPFSDVWTFSSNIGPVAITSAFGPIGTPSI